MFFLLSRHFKFLLLIMSVLCVFNESEGFADCSVDTTKGFKLYGAANFAYGVTTGATVERRDSGHVSNLEIGVNTSPIGMVCPFYSLGLISGKANFKDSDLHASATLNLKLGISVRVGGRTEIFKDIDALLKIGLGAADVDYTAKGLNIEKSGAWAGRVAELTGGVAWKVLQEAEIQGGISATHIVTATGNSRGVDDFSDPTSSDPGKAVNINIIGVFLGLGYFF